MWVPVHIITDRINLILTHRSQTREEGTGNMYLRWAMIFQDLPVAVVVVRHEVRKGINMSGSKR